MDGCPWDKYLEPLVTGWSWPCHQITEGLCGLVTACIAGEQDHAVMVEAYKNNRSGRGDLDSAISMYYYVPPMMSSST